MKKQEPNEFDRNSDTILSRDVTRINKCIHEQKKNYNETSKRPWKKGNLKFKYKNIHSDRYILLFDKDKIQKWTRYSPKEIIKQERKNILNRKPERNVSKWVKSNKEKESNTLPKTHKA